MRKMGSVPFFLDETHDPALKSWVESANAPGCDFPIQNLPFGIFRRKNSREKRRAGVAIGDQIFDLAALGVKIGPTLNGLAAMGRPAWKRLRKEISKALAKPNKRFKKHLVPMKRAELFLPVAVGDYTDFYSSVFHATNVGRLFRPDNPLLPNYKWLPIGYHGRASSVVVSGTPVIRPSGQTKSPDQASPSFGPSKRLDYEAELAFVVGPGNPLGKRIPLQKALDHIFGVVLLNDWSARDIQAWEYQPLGPFLAKSFGTTISPWVVTLEALAPFRAQAASRSKSRCTCEAPGCAPRSGRPCASRAATTTPPTGRRRSSSPTTARTAATCSRATWSAREPSPARRRTRSARCSSSPRAARPRWSCRAAKRGLSSRMTTR